MGRWAQARRRGRTAPPAGPAGPPPAPGLDASGGSLLQTATGGDDTGGTVELQNALLEEGPFEDLDSAAWEAVRNWGPNYELEGFFYRAREVGNGVDYVGSSDWSNVVEIN